MIIPSKEQRSHWATEGYVVFPGLIDNVRLDALIGAIDQMLEPGRAGTLARSIRWLDDEKRVPEFISDLLSADKYAPAFGDFLDTLALPIVETLIQAPVRCTWLLLLTGGAGQAYQLPLHRDNSAVNTPEETDLLERYRDKNFYFQAALVPDSSFRLVPGSHLRVANEVEIAATKLGGHAIDVPA